MKLISHRGNINGVNPNKENSPGYILEALKKYNVEIDVWYITESSKWYLGHDEPKYEFDIILFKKYFDKMWFHCNNLDALYKVIEYDIHYFWHQKDDYTLTSKNHIWTYPGNTLTDNSICVLPEQSNYTQNELSNCYGICSDFIVDFSTYK